MINKPAKILVYGIGNPGRQDDSLGIELSYKIDQWKEKKRYESIDVVQNYQLNIEDAERLSHYSHVIFADASIDTESSYKYISVTDKYDVDFSMHSVTPSFVLGLCRVLFKKEVAAYELHIRGEKWEFMEPLSANAIKNLEIAANFLKKELENILMTE